MGQKFRDRQAKAMTQHVKTNELSYNWINLDRYTKYDLESRSSDACGLRYRKRGESDKEGEGEREGVE